MHQTWKTLNDIYSSWWKSTESVSRAYPSGADENLPEGLSVFHVPENHRRKLRTTNLAERPDAGDKASDKSSWGVP
jgi:hypothetical protein